MPPTSQNIEFAGYFTEGLLGIFKIIRGFAGLRNLAVISAPYKSNEGPGTETIFHLADIKRFIWPKAWLSKGRND